MYPILLQVGVLGLRTFPLVLALAIWVGVKLAAAEGRRRGLDPGLATDFLTTAVVLGLAGARLFHMLLFDPGWYLAHPADVLAVWTGGLAFPGALLAGVGGAIWFCRRAGVGFWRFADAAAPGLALGQGIGAVAAFLNGSGYGTPTHLPWAVVFADPRGQAPLGIPLHPAQLYEAVGAVLLFGVLWGVRTRFRQDGALFLVYLAGVFALAGLDFVRGDALWMAEAGPAAPMVGVIGLIGAALLWRRQRSAGPVLHAAGRFGLTDPDEAAAPGALPPPRSP